MIQLFNKPKKCNCITNNNKKCKYKMFKLYNVNNTLYCTIHFKQYYTKTIIYIQKMWRAYYCRKKLNIYIKLPDDIQRIIKKHINKKHYYIKMTKTINNILNNKTTSICNKFYIKYYNIYQGNCNYYDLKSCIEQIHNNYTLIQSLCKLYRKYRFWDNVNTITIKTDLKNCVRLYETLLYYYIDAVSFYNEDESIVNNNIKTITNISIDIRNSIYSSNS